MKLTFDQFILQTNKLDKILITLVFFFPIFLSISIFAADFSASFGYNYIDFNYKKIFFF